MKELSEKLSVSKSREDYLEAIFMIKEKKGLCKAIDIAKLLHVSKPSVSFALKQLEEENYVVKNENSEIELSKDGLMIAKNVFGRHLFFKTLLIDVGVSEDTADRDACLMEHEISEESFIKLKKWYKEVKK